MGAVHGGRYAAEEGGVDKIAQAMVRVVESLEACVSCGTPDGYLCWSVLVIYFSCPISVKLFQVSCSIGFGRTDRML